MTISPAVLSSDDQAAWVEDGFILLRGFAPPSTADTCARMLDRAVELARLRAAGESVGRAFVTLEARPNPDAHDPEDLVSKIFRLHRDTVFEEFAHSPPVLDAVADLLGADIDVFLSQFIFKTPGAYGQPWHQDSYYFPFDPPERGQPGDQRAVGVWLAVTEATLANGCLHVIPRSHREPIHEHVPDQRPGSNYGYVEIVDHDMSTSTPVLMEPGDLLLFDSHLMHRSTDNETKGIRAAMVYHYARAGTVDHTAPERTINDWVPARRAG